MFVQNSVEMLEEVALSFSAGAEFCCGSGPQFFQSKINAGSVCPGSEHLSWLLSEPSLQEETKEEDDVMKKEAGPV